MKFKVGDLVSVGGIWKKKGKRMVGVILADETAPYVIRNHYDVKHCIVEEKDIKLIKKAVLTEEQIGWCLPRGGA